MVVFVHAIAWHFDDIEKFMIKIKYIKLIFKVYKVCGCIF